MPEVAEHKEGTEKTETGGGKTNKREKATDGVNNRQC